MDKSRFTPAENGAVAPVFAMLLLVILAFGGGTIDYLRAQAAQNELQLALDTSVLSAMASNSTDRVAEGARLFQANISSSHLKRAVATFAITGNGNIEGRAELKVSSSMLKLIGIHYLPVSVKAAAAAPRPSTIDVTFEPITAKGAYDKQIAIFVRDQSGAIVNEIPVLEYNWTGPAGPNGSTAVTSLYGGQDTFTVTVESGWSYGLRMRVWPDLNLQGSRAVEPTDYYSDINANHIQRSGDCTSEETNNWEDTGDFDYLDFIYKMRCTSAAASTQGAHLIQ